MRKALLYTFFCLLPLSAFFKAEGQNVSEAIQNSQNAPVIKAGDLEKLSRPALANGSEKLHFTDSVLNFGRISSETTSVEGSFSFTYLGESGIAITKITTSCSCLKAEFSSKKLTHGSKGSVKVSYVPKGHFGSVNQRIFLYSTLSRSAPSAVLTVEAEVSSNESEDFPFALGSLSVRRTEVSFNISDDKAVERIACYNSSDKPLTLKAIKEFTPSGLSFRSEPETLSPGSEGELVIAWDKNKADKAALNKKELMLILEGISAPPSKRSIKIRLIK